MYYVYNSSGFAFAFFVYKRVWKGKIRMQGNYCLERKMNRKQKKTIHNIFTARKR